MTKVWLIANEVFSEGLENGNFISFCEDGTENLNVVSLEVEELIKDLAKLHHESSVSTQSPRAHALRRF